MSNLKRLAWGVLVASGLVTLAAGPALADVSDEGGGDFTVTPLYRTFAFGGIDRDAATSPGYAGSDIFGIDYKSNSAPRGVATIAGTVCDDGLHPYGTPCVGTTSYSAIGQAYPSGMGVGRNYAEMTVTNAKATDMYYLVAGVGEAKKVQFFAPGAQESGGYVTFTWRVTGSEVNPLLNAGARATGRIDFGASLDPSTNWTQLFNDPGGALDSFTNFGPGTYTSNLPIANLSQALYLYYWSSAFVEVDPGQALAGSSFTLVADYSHTVVLENVQLFDADMAPVSQWTLAASDTGQSLFDQTGRLAPIEPAVPIPEPGTWAMWLVGAVAIGRKVRRDQR